MNTITTTIVHETSVYRKEGSSTFTSLVELRIEDSTEIKSKLFRFVYRNGNAFEEFNGECLNKKSGKWNKIFNIGELGVRSYGSSYLDSETELKKRVKSLVDCGKEYLKILYS